VVSDAISDTGPILHLTQVQRFNLLAIFTRVVISEQVDLELRSRHIAVSAHASTTPGFTIDVQAVPAERIGELCSQVSPMLSDADISVLALAEDLRISPVLTDDLTLRRVLESRRHEVVGTIGVAIRAYTVGILTRTELDTVIEALFDKSTLYLSAGFRHIIREKLRQLV